VPERRLPDMVKGKRVKTVGVHSHCLFQDAANLTGDDAVPVTSAQNQFIVIAEPRSNMDAIPIDMEVLSINPFW
jgi:aminocarboxymuconate-semialdehyde decarboxylase